jgi:hypothetical protein
LLRIGTAEDCTCERGDAEPHAGADGSHLPLVATGCNHGAP